jgi:hypothetical protein
MGKYLHWFIAALFLPLIALVGVSGCMEQPVKNTTPVPGPALIVEYYRTGGIAGVEDHLVIFENGAVVYSGRQGRGGFILNRSEVDGIKDLFQRAEFSRMNGTYPPKDAGADYFNYIVYYQNHTVRATDTGVPSGLEPIILRLNDVVSGRGNTTAFQ